MDPLIPTGEIKNPENKKADPAAECHLNRDTSIKSNLVDENSKKVNLRDNARFSPLLLTAGFSDEHETRVYLPCEFRGRKRLISTVTNTGGWRIGRLTETADQIALLTLRVTNKFADHIDCNFTPTPERDSLVNGLVPENYVSREVGNGKICGLVDERVVTGRDNGQPQRQVRGGSSGEPFSLCEVTDSKERGYLYFHTLNGPVADPDLFWPPSSPHAPKQPVPALAGAKARSAGFAPLAGRPGMNYGWIQGNCQGTPRLYVIHATDQLKPRLPEIFRAFVTAADARDGCQPSFG